MIMFVFPGVLSKIRTVLLPQATSAQCGTGSNIRCMPEDMCAQPQSQYKGNRQVSPSCGSFTTRISDAAAKMSSLCAQKTGLLCRDPPCSAQGQPITKQKNRFRTYVFLSANIISSAISLFCTMRIYISSVMRTGIVSFRSVQLSRISFYTYVYGKTFLKECYRIAASYTLNYVLI